MSFGARLTEARKRKNLTQEALGRGLGTDGKDASKAVVYGWEKDQHYPRVDQLELICEKLDCSADYLLRGVVATSSLSAEVAALAAEIDSIPAPERARVLTLCRQVLELAHESVNRAKGANLKNVPAEPPADLPPPHVRAA